MVCFSCSAKIHVELRDILWIYSMVTDFFGIFFTLTWVFYSSEVIAGEYLGYFNIFGFIWIWKIGISIGVPVAIGLILFFGFGFWNILYEEYRDFGSSCNCSFIGFCVAFFIFG